MRRYAIVAMFLALAGLVGLAYADDKADPTGTWKWSYEAGGKTREGKLKLKKEGDKLTGAVIGGNNRETTIDDVKLKDGEISFSVTREFNGNSFTIKYAATLADDTLKMKDTRPGRDGGEPVTTEVEAKKESDKTKA